MNKLGQYHKPLKDMIDAELASEFAKLDSYIEDAPIVDLPAETIQRYIDIASRFRLEVMNEISSRIDVGETYDISTLWD